MKLLGALLFCVTCAALPLPSYIKPCSRSDPNFDACAVKQANEVIPKFINGDKEFKVPSLNPLHIAQIAVEDSGMQFHLSDVTIHGLREARIDTVHFDFDKYNLLLEEWFPKLEILGQYTLAGRLLGLDIKGVGDINITLEGCKVEFDCGYTLHETEGREYMKLGTPTTTVTPANMHVSLTNLFGGNNMLGDELNRFLNENWREVFKETAPAIVQALNNLTVTLINRLASVVSYNDIFPK